MSTALFISSDNPARGEVNTSLFRIAIPGTYLSRAGHDIRLQNVPPISHEMYGEVDQVDLEDVPEVVLVERTITPERVKMLRLAGAKRLVATFDDNYAMLPEDSPAKPWWRKHLAGWLEALGQVDLVIVPSQQLVQDFGKYCRAIQLVPNYHDPELWAVERPASDHKVIGWGGSMEHQQSWQRSGIIPALKKALERHLDWQLHVHGLAAGQLLRMAGVPFVQVPWCNLGYWAAYVRGFDIGLAPLHGEYDARRSNLKVLEYGLAGVPYLASRAAPYLEPMNPGGLLIDRPSLWADALERLMDDQAQREALGRCGQEWAQQFTMDKNVGVYEKVLWP